VQPIQYHLCEEIAHNITCWELFCIEPWIKLILHQTPYFLVIVVKTTEIIISSFNSKLGDQFTTPGPSPNQLEHTKSIGTYRSLEATIYIIYLYISHKI
jgi:hypothetical protein